MNLDSLMDILSCLVGVMLFLVIYTVLELGSATYQADIPIVRDPPTDSRRVVILAEQGTIRGLELEQAYEQLFAGFEIVRSYDDMELFVANQRTNPRDDYFEYSIEAVERLSNDLIGAIDMNIVEIGGAVGDSVHQLGTGSRYDRLLNRLDPAQHWLSFAVDSTSVDIYRRARDRANARGFATRWDPATLELPLTLALTNSPPDEWISITGPAVKPIR